MDTRKSNAVRASLQGGRTLPTYEVYLELDGFGRCELVQAVDLETAALWAGEHYGMDVVCARPVRSEQAERRAA